MLTSELSTLGLPKIPSLSHSQNMIGWVSHECVRTPHRFQHSNQLAYTPNFQLTHTFRALAKSLNILLGKREGGVCVTVGGWKASIGRRDWDRRGSEQWGLSWLCEPPQGELCQIVNVNQTSGKWGAGLFTAEEKKWRIYIEDRGIVIWSSSCLPWLCGNHILQKVMWRESSTLKFISLLPPEFLQTTSHSLGLPTLSWLGHLESWKVSLLEVKCEVGGM